MSRMYEHYITGKKPTEITHGIVTDIHRRRLIGEDVNTLVDELEQNGILGDTTVKLAPKSEWNEEYLKLLACEAVGGTFSKQYLLLLAEVAKYIEDRKKKSKIFKIIAVLLAITTVIAIVVCVITFNAKG